MKVLFTVQGEGRGHLTQAISMKEMLQRRGHEIVGVLVGSNRSRPLPEYFESSFEVPVQQLVSPGFSFKEARGVSTLESLKRIMCDLPAYQGSVRLLRRAIKDTAPDVIVNFLEPTMGLHNLLFGARVPTLVVGHQYMLEHPEFVPAQEFTLQQHAMRAYIALVGARSSRLALSLYPAADKPLQRLVVCPPILRQQLLEAVPSAGDYLLVYLLNHGYADAIHRWHTLHPQIPIHCFYDKPNAPAEARIQRNLTFHRLHGEKFLRLMAGARAVACTAGFESVSEAAYLGKRLLMIPVENHVEQYLNACDAEQTGLGMRDREFQLSRLLAPAVKPPPPEFRCWVDQAETVAMTTVERVAGMTQSPALSSLTRQTLATELVT